MDYNTKPGGSSRYLQVRVESKETPRAVQYKNLFGLSRPVRKLVRQLGPLRLQISLEKPRENNRGLELPQQADNLIVVADDQQLDEIAPSTKQNAIAPPCLNFPDAGLEQLEAEPKGALALSVEAFELVQGLIDTVLSRRVQRLIRPLEGGGVEIPH